MKYNKVASVGALVFMLGAGSIFAYLSDGDHAHNVFSIGSNTIVPEEPFDPVEPGKKTVKEPKAENTGTVDCYVRAKVLLSDSRVEEYLTYYTSSMEGVNKTVWNEDKDGWLYCEKSIAPGEKTAPVFTHIKLKEELPEEIKDVAIDVVFESVQSEGFEDAKTAFTAVEGNRIESKKEGAA